jgi:phospholipid transport system substrate-binding protein
MRTDLFRFILRSAPVLLAFAAVRVACASGDDPATMLRSSIEEILSIAYSGRNETLPARVRPALEKSFAFDLVTRQAMGPGWRQFSAADQKRVTELFSELVIRTYSARVVGTQRPKIAYGTAVTIASDRCEIPTRVSQFTASSSNEPIAVVYRMIRLPAGWRIYDVLIEGVSFVSNYRAQFEELIQKGGAPLVIRTLEAKLAAPAASRS